MPRRRREVLVGGFIFLSVVLLLLLLFLMGAMDWFLEDHARVDVEFTDVHGLHVGDPVFLFGLKVGSVSKLEILPREGDAPARLRCVLRFPAKFREYVRTDTAAVIDRSITGTLRVFLREGRGPALPVGGVLVGSATPEIADVAARMDRVLGDAEKIAGDVAVVVEEIRSRADIGRAFAELASFPEEFRKDLVPVRERLTEVLDLLHELVEENRVDMRHSVANLRETTDRARALTDELLAAPGKIDTTLEELRAVAAQAADLIGENRRGVGSLVSDLRTTATNASQLTAEIRRRPWLLLYKPDAEELEEMDLYDAAWAFNLGATELNRSLRDLLDHLGRETRGEEPGAESRRELDLAYERVRESLRKQQEVEEAFWKRLNAGQ